FLPQMSTTTTTTTTTNYLTNLGLGYSIAIALGFLVLLSTLLLAFYICCRSRHHPHHHSNPTTPTPTDGIILPRIIFVAEDDDQDSNPDENLVVGLDQSVINSYPKFLFTKDANNSLQYLNLTKLEMRNSYIFTKLGTLGGIRKPILLFGSIAILICIATLSKFYSISSLRISDNFYNHGKPDSQSKVGSQARTTVETVIQKIRKEMNELREMPIESSASTYVLRYSSFLADILGLLESAHESLLLNEGTYQQSYGLIEAVHPLVRPKEQPDEPANFFLIEEIRKYVKIKPNRLGKQNFMGANGTFTSIGHACFAMKRELEEYMNYDVGEICNDDWKLAQKLMVHGCDPLPRRRCFARAPQLYSKPFSINESMWKLPDDRNVRWSQYRCKNFTCLANESTRKGFFKCASCFNLSHHELPRWIEQVDLDPIINVTADFLIAEVLDIKPGEIRIGLDFSAGTGTFAARMREFNVTIVSASINLGAPFNEMIALRGLVPLYLTINQRLPFFDNTLDLIHTTRFLDGWIDFVLLDFVLYDWDRSLRPGGLLWVDSFFCLKEDLDDYLEAFKMLRYKKHKWVVIPKRDKGDDREVFFSAVLEKPPRPFR
ncbi:Methyltransf_29 domain-containing protein, partial [Cephalotus follicularis]